MLAEIVVRLCGSGGRGSMAEERILVVEDDLVLRRGIREFLESRGFGVADAPDLKQARAQFQRERPDAVVLDYLLPDGNALDFLPELLGIDPQLPVILLTGHGSI